ncbi:MAG: DUF1800 domain-containing protein [Gemmatimonadetes bacterium]|nr:DUF1800 domain-containing protein [Gemmatimonadota bacterium]
MSKRTGHALPSVSLLAWLVPLLFAGGFPAPRLAAQTANAASSNVASADAASGNAPLTPDQRIIHVLSRLSYGPRPGDIERVEAMGVEAYIEEQLRPAEIADDLVREKLAPFTTLNLNLLDGDRVYRLVDAQSVRRQALADQKAMMARVEGLQPPSGSPSTDSLMAARLRRSMLNSRVSGKVVPTERLGEVEILQARMIRAVHSDRQLYEMMVDFWMNHFSVFFDTDEYLTVDYEERAIRPHVMGNFEDLLIATAQHPAMLMYLDNWISTAPEVVVQARLEAGHAVYPDRDLRRSLAIRERAEYFQEASGLNENYGRELMELHTLGVDGGYTQQDVMEVARAFTGWTVTARRQRGYFTFDPLLHVEGDKLVLGRTIESGGMDEGMEILTMLAHHPSTASFISTKLVRRFVADDPPPEIVAAAARTFLETDGDITAVLRTIFTSPEFFAPEHYQVKIKKPIEVVASGIRATGAELDVMSEATYSYVQSAMARMGEDLYRHEAPDGFPDVGSAWIATSALSNRIRFAVDLAASQIPAVTPDLPSAISLLTRMGFAEPTEEVNTELATLVDQLILDAAARRWETTPIDRDLVIRVAAALGSPQFQTR